MLWKLIKDSSETWRYSFAENIQDSYLHFRAKRHLPGDQSFVAQLWEHPVSDLKKMELYWYMWVDLLFYTYFASFITQYLTMLCFILLSSDSSPPPHRVVIIFIIIKIFFYVCWYRSRQRQLAAYLSNPRNAQIVIVGGRAYLHQMCERQSVSPNTRSCWLGLNLRLGLRAFGSSCVEERTK